MSRAYRLRPESTVAEINTIAATRALAHSGLALFRAKRAVESVVSGKEVTLVLPNMTARDHLVKELTAAGVNPGFLIEVDPAAVKRMRSES